MNTLRQYANNINYAIRHNCWTQGVSYLGAPVSWVQKQLLRQTNGIPLTQTSMEIDHIIPVSAFQEFEEHLRVALHYTNLQLLPQSVNRKKHAKWNSQRSIEDIVLERLPLLEKSWYFNPYQSPPWIPIWIYD